MAKKDPKSVATSVPSIIALEPIAVDIKQAAKFLGTSVHQIRTLIYGQELKAFTLGKKQLLRVADLRDFINKKVSEETEG